MHPQVPRSHLHIPPFLLISWLPRGEGGVCAIRSMYWVHASRPLCSNGRLFFFFKLLPILLLLNVIYSLGGGRGSYLCINKGQLIMPPIASKIKMLCLAKKMLHCLMLAYLSTSVWSHPHPCPSHTDHLSFPLMCQAVSSVRNTPRLLPPMPAPWSTQPRDPSFLSLSLQPHLPGLQSIFLVLQLAPYTRHPGEQGSCLLFPLLHPQGLAECLTRSQIPNICQKNVPRSLRLMFPSKFIFAKIYFDLEDFSEICIPRHIRKVTVRAFE